MTINIDKNQIKEKPTIFWSKTLKKKKKRLTTVHKSQRTGDLATTNFV